MNKQDANKQKPLREAKHKLTVLGTSEEKISLKNRVYGAKPTPTETIDDIKDIHRQRPLVRLKTDVTDTTKRRRRRRDLKRLE